MTTPQLENFGDVMPSGVSAVDDLSNGVEIAHAAMCDAGRHVEMTGQAIDDACEHLSAMATLTQTLDAQPEAISGPVLEALESAVKGFVGLMGGDRTSVSMESRADKPNTQVALESLADTFKRLWDRLLAALKAAWTWFKNFIAKVFDASHHIQRRVAKLRKILSTCADSQAVETMKPSNRLLTFTGGVGRGTLSGAQITTAYHTQTTLMTNIQRGAGGFMKDASQGLKDVLAEYNRLANEAPDLQAQKFEDFVKRHVWPLFVNASMYKQAGATKVTGKAVEAREGTDLYVRDLFLGGGRFYGRVISQGQDESKTASALRYTGFGISRGERVVQAEALKTWSKVECEAALKLVDERMELLRTLNAESKTLDESLAQLLRVGKNFQITAGHEALRAAMMEKISNCAVVLMNVATTSNRTFVHYDIDCAKTMLDLVGANVKTMHDPLQKGLLDVAKQVADARAA